MWNKMKSLALSRFLVLVMFGLLTAMLFCIPLISGYFECFSDGKGIIKNGVFTAVCIMLYICEVFAFAAVTALYRLLKNISAGDVFSAVNAKCLRIISWSCMLAGMNFVFFSLWRFEFLFAAFFAVFLGLILRVLKNVFDEAVEIKAENDYTV